MRGHFLQSQSTATLAKFAIPFFKDFCREVGANELEMLAIHGDIYCSERVGSLGSGV